MFEKIKAFFKKNFLVVFIVIAVISVFILIAVLFLGKDNEDLVERENFVEEEFEPYKEYSMGLTDGVVNEIDDYAGVYKTYRVMETAHLSWARSFALATKGESLKYREKVHPAVPGSVFHTLDQSIYYFEDGEDFVKYDYITDLLTFSFETPVNLKDVDINSRSEEGALGSLNEISSKFFSGDFQYRIKEVSRVGNNYLIEYSRILEQAPINDNLLNLYLLVTPDGRLSSGIFLLAEFEEFGEVSISSGEIVRGQLGDAEYPKAIRFYPLEVEEKSVYSGVTTANGSETVSVDFSKIDFGYLYESKFDDIVSPYFFLEGTGSVTTPHKKDAEARFDAIIN